VLDQDWTLARGAERFGVSVTTARHWADRYRLQGRVGMVDRSASDVAVDACEPQLLHLLVDRVILHVPYGWHKRPSFLVDRKSLEAEWTFVLRSVSWNCRRRFRAFTLRGPLSGMPGAPTVSQAPMNRVRVSTGNASRISRSVGNDCRLTFGARECADRLR
jgi:helix-turn-helix protein